MYTVIGTPRSRAIRVIWALEELGLDYKIKAMPLGPAALEWNPEGKVPVLETPEGRLTDSLAIMTFLADKHGDPTSGISFAAGSFARGRQDGHAQFVCDELDGVLWSYTKHHHVLPQALRVKEAVAPAFNFEIEIAFERLIARVGDGPFLMGERFTIPDILAAQCGGWAKFMQVEPPAEVAAYLERCYGRPSNARVRARSEAAIKEAGLS